MDTIIKIKTWVCLKCKAHQDTENEGICFSCGSSVILETDVTKKAIVTIIGEENIGGEIKSIKESKVKTIDISTIDKENAYIKSRKEDIKRAIKEWKNSELIIL